MYNMKFWRKHKKGKKDNLPEERSVHTAHRLQREFVVGVQTFEPCFESYFDDLSIIDQTNISGSPSLRRFRSCGECCDVKTDKRPFDEIHWKVILLGRTGVGKTSLLVQYGSKRFKPRTFSFIMDSAFMVMLVGDSGVGKTCLLIRFRDGYFLSGNFISTVGIDFRTRVVKVDDTKVKLHIWDTAGQERFKSVTHSYYREADALLLVYDVTNLSSFENARAWLEEIKNYGKEDAVIMLLGNKVDCDSDRMVEKQGGERLAKEHNAIFMETSAKTGENVELVFLAIAKELKARNTEEPEKSSFNVNDYVKEKTRKPKCSNCNA